MTTSTVASNATATTPSQTLTRTSVKLFAAAILGMIVLIGIGFAPMDAVHNAAHDTRHSFAFPCH